MRINENSSRLRLAVQVAAVAILASASAACSNASRFGLPMFTGSTNGTAQRGGAQPLPPASLGTSASASQPTPNPNAGYPVAGYSPTQAPSQVARADLPPLTAGASAPAPAATPLPTYTYGAPNAPTPVSATPAPATYSTAMVTPPPRPAAAAPAPASAPTQIAAASGPQVITVAPGQTLYSISRTYGVSLEALMRANGISNASRVQAGQQIRIPGTTGGSSAAGVQLAAGPSNLGTIPAPGTTRTDATAVPPQLARPSTPVSVAPAPAPTVIAAAPPTPAPSIVAPQPTATPVAAEPASTSGTEFRWPVHGRIISSFGVKPDGERNDGINLAVPEGTSVKATEAGTVIYAGNEIAGYGNLILVRHAGGWVSAYAHNKEIMVERGQTVVRGQTIALAGATGSVSQPQVHFELRQGSTPVNPLDHLTGA
jgi:murein DD-endopeptidase MepM/ murein hydrolase activator NlpD